MKKIILVCLLVLNTSAFAGKKYYQLKYPIPNGWKLVYHVKSQLNTIKEYLPPNETVHRWTRMLTVLEFNRLPTYVMPEDFLKKTFSLAEPQCQSFSSRIYTSVTKNKVKESTGIQYCGKYAKTGLGEITMFKALKADKMYVVQLAKRSEPFIKNNTSITRKQLSEWQRSMDAVQVVRFRKSNKLLNKNLKFNKQER